MGIQIEIVVTSGWPPLVTTQYKHLIAHLAKVKAKAREKVKGWGREIYRASSGYSGIARGMIAFSGMTQTPMVFFQKAAESRRAQPRARDRRSSTSE